MTTKLGLEGQTFYQTDGVSGIAGWVEADSVKNVTLSLSKSEADNTTRANGGWKSTRGTLKDASIELELPHDPTDAHFAVFRDSYLNNTHIGLRVYDGDDNGLEADVEVTDMQKSEDIEDVQTFTFTAKITYVDTAPAWNEAP